MLHALGQLPRAEHMARRSLASIETEIALLDGDREAGEQAAQRRGNDNAIRHPQKRQPGLCGTGGVSYLRKTLDVVLFPEVWSLRTEL